MNYKQHLLNCIKTEVETCKHLYSRVTPEHLQFRPKENIRSIEEVLRYLTWCGVVMIAQYARGTAETANDNYLAYSRRGENLRMEEFVRAMDDQMEEIGRLFELITEEELYTRMVVYPWRAKAPLGEAIAETSIKWLAAYKMQLFLALKMAGGNDDLNTLDCWIRPYMHTREQPWEAVYNNARRAV